MAVEATIQHSEQRVEVAGILTASHINSLWPQACAVLKNLHTLDIQGVTQLDSAGLAFLVAWVTTATQYNSGEPCSVVGCPPGFEALLAAYRLPPMLLLHQ